MTGLIGRLEADGLVPQDRRPRRRTRGPGRADRRRPRPACRRARRARRGPCRPGSIFSTTDARAALAAALPALDRLIATSRHRFLDQPRSVWAVAFACVVAFMGIGLVDPILPVLAHDLDATPSQVSLLFTSYFAMTGLSMLVTGWFASRIGPRRTLLFGLALVVVFAALAGASDTVLPDRRLPARVGVRQRALHRHRAVGDRRRRDRRADRARSSCTRPRSGSGSRPGRCSAACSATSGWRAARSSARRC